MKSRYFLHFIALSLVAFGLPQLALADTTSTLLKEVSTTSGHINAVKNKTFTLTYGKRTWVVPAATIKQWYKTQASGDGLLLQLRPGAIYDYLNINVSPKVNVLGTNSRFQYVGTTIQLLSGGTKGQIVDGLKTSLAIRTALAAGKTTAAVSVMEQRPALFSAEDFKKLKFPDLIGHGETSFAGSPANRIFNINVATARYNGVVIMPNQEFSFNSYLGTVDATNGYKPELVIKENVTTPEFGGGICQVSTTTFRAAMYAGLKITYRRNHSYPVAYYGPPGFDATVYQPSPDLKFINDTGSPILIKTSIVGSKLTFDFWGKSDGRQVTINGPFVTEKKPDGSITAAIAQIVKKNGKTVREDNFVSHYQPASKFPHVKAANGG